MSSIKLRALTNSDIPITLAWSNKDAIKDFYANHPFPVNIEMEKEWYDKILKSNFPTTVFGIELIDEKKLIGITVLKNINLIHRNAEFAIFIGDNSELGKGYSKEATFQTLSFGFNQLGLVRIFCHVQDNNISAIKLYERTGFVKEGLLRKSVFKNGSFIGEIIMGILKEEFIQNEL